MKKLYFTILFLLFSFVIFAQQNRVILGAEQTKAYLPILKNKRVALFSNHTGMVGDKHTLDILIENKVNVVAIFSPEHGFRGTADAGEHVSSSVDEKRACQSYRFTTAIQDDQAKSISVNLIF